jgi:mono/diheme cytochrome c family protein
LMRSPFVLVAALLLASCGEDPKPDGATEKPMSTGERIYEQHCALCHGHEGGMMMGGAKDLRESTIKREEAVAVVTQGRNAMTSYKNVLKPAEIEAVVDHVLTLRRSAEKTTDEHR